MGRLILQFYLLAHNQTKARFCLLFLSFLLPFFVQAKTVYIVPVGGLDENKFFYDPNALYGERRKVLSFFASRYSGELDLYGPGWEGYRDWKGTIPHKWEVLKNYKFCFCYENMCNQQGYITEKIFDCMVGGCVPIYLGATNIADYVPKECFIDRRDFSTEEELYSFLKSMNEKTYQSYMDAMRSYFESPLAELYSIDNFISIILSNID